MLNPLRKKLTLICVLTTGILISVMAMAILSICENQMEKQSNAAFQNSVNSIIYKIQSSHLVENTWLSQLESESRLIIHIEDNAVPIVFQGSWTPDTDRETLIKRTQRKAQKDHGLDIKIKPYSVINVDSEFFRVEGDRGDEYQAAAALIPSASGWQSLTVLMDRSPVLHQKMIIRVSFCLIILFSLLFLFFFSWWFAGRAIRPIEENQRKQAEFIAAASHELRSPLAVIQTSVSALLSDNQSAQDDKAAESNRFIAAADRECKRMSSLISDLLFLASSDAGTWSIQAEPVEIDTLLMDVYESYEQLAKAGDHKLTLELPEEALPAISGDKQRLWQALAVLLNNALAYTPPGGSIILSVTLQKKSISIKVSDHGIGIPDEKKEHIFDRFYRADPSRSQKEHYGLGLSIAKEIIELHSGTIAVTDTPGGGATFLIKLNR